MLAETIRLKTASEEDADTIRTLAKTGLMAAKAQLSKESEMPEAVKKLFMDALRLLRWKSLIVSLQLELLLLKDV